MENWYVLFMKSGDEKKVCELLNREQFKAFVPKMKVMHRKAGVSSLVEKVMFPGYVFVESVLNQNDFVMELRKFQSKMQRYLKLLKIDEQGTAVLYPEEQQYLKSILNDEMVMDHSIGMIEGDKTIVTSGPLMGLENTIVKIDRHKRKAIIQVMICNQPTLVHVSLEIISKTK